MNANDIQIGGDHYRKAGNSQHWDKLPHVGFGWEYYVGRATAYLTRVKNTDEDPQKAGHFVDKLVELIDAGLVPREFQTTQGKRLNCDTGRGNVDVVYYLEKEYFPANGIRVDSDAAEAIRVLMTARTKDDLIVARERIARIEAAATDKPTTSAGMPVESEPTTAYVNQDNADGSGI
jgi:hypothetical protein